MKMDEALPGKKHKEKYSGTLIVRETIRSDSNRVYSSTYSEEELKWMMQKYMRHLYTERK